MNSHATASLDAVNDLPRAFNATEMFVLRHVAEGRGGKLAVIDDHGRYSYAELAERVARCGNMLGNLGLRIEDRVAMCMLDTVDFPTVFWGSILAGIVPIPLNTLLTTKDYEYMLRDSRARVLFVSDTLYEKFEPILGDLPFLQYVIVVGENTRGHDRFSDLLARADTQVRVAPTTCDDIAFWLYSSARRGRPRASCICTATLWRRRSCSAGACWA